MKTKKLFRKKSHSAEKNWKGGPLVSSGFAITRMRFPGIRLVEQTEQKFRRIRVCLEQKNE